MEEFLDGPDLTMISFVNKSKLYPICLIEEMNIENSNGIISRKGFRTLKSDPNNWEIQAIKIAKMLISELNIKCSPLNLSFRVDSKNNLRLIEVHLDMGGEELIESFFPKALRVDFLKLAIKILMGNFKDTLNVKTKPTAILFKGRLVSEGYNLFTAKTDCLLEKKIMSL